MKCKELLGKCIEWFGLEIRIQPRSGSRSLDKEWWDIRR